MKKYDCPVCHMLVLNAEYTALHHGIPYRFCSQQCEQNFTARPRLYLKPVKKMVLKNRVLVLEGALPPAKQQTVRASLLKMMGVKSARFKQQRLLVAYNLLEVTAFQIEKRLQIEGVGLDVGWMPKFKQSWIHYSEENALNHLAEPEGACCNKPPAKG